MNRFAPIVRILGFCAILTLVAGCKSDDGPDAKTASNADQQAAPGSVPSQPQDQTDDSPIPIGSPAPDFTVVGLPDKKPIKLSSLKGKVVMVDLWATWCPPCRESLPHTEAIYKDLAQKGLVVMATSDEDPATIQSFWKKEGYTMPVFQYAGEGMSAYKVDAIPTVLIIDKKGNLANYFVGEQPESDLRAALKKAGVE